jgi:hypothetical protein
MKHFSGGESIPAERRRRGAERDRKRRNQKRGRCESRAMISLGDEVETVERVV